MKAKIYVSAHIGFLLELDVQEYPQSQIHEQAGPSIKYQLDAILATNDNLRILGDIQADIVTETRTIHDGETFIEEYTHERIQKH